VHINEAFEYLTTHNATAVFWKDNGAPKCELVVIVETRDGIVTLSSVGATLELASEELMKSVERAKAQKPFKRIGVSRRITTKQGG
jgi:hypothetical protein